MAATARISFAFAGDASHAACLTGGDDGRLNVESWRFTPSGAERRVLPTSQGESTWTQLLCRPDGGVVLTRPGPGFHRLVLATPSGERPLATIPSPAVRLVASPGEQELALAFARTGDGDTAIWRVLDGDLEKVAELPGVVTGGHRLGAHLLGLTHHHGDAPTPIELDLRSGSFQPIAGTSPGQHLLLSGRRLLLVGTVDGRLRLGHALPGEPPAFPGVLDTIEGLVAPMAVSIEDFALRVDRGTRSHLVVYTPGEERIRPVATPPGIIHNVSAWGPGGLRFPFSAPAQPGGIATVDPATGSWELAADGEGDWADAEVHEFAGPAGPIEAVVYGDWRRARHLVISLHGGPEAAAQLNFDPFPQRLAAAGIAVVAPNYRGSTGYGQEHQQALQGAWGGPDLDDIRHLGRLLAAEGRTLMLHGTSYGAFLGLLAAAADPWLWSRCVAVAPFVSGPSLYQEGSPAVQALIERLGGREVIDDALGPRDLTLLAPRITARLMVVHGRNDEVIPVGQSRLLRDCLLRAGRELDYVEPPTGGHDPTYGEQGPELIDRLVRFLLAP
ncbi:prolyl oligopeptidase family serine peptidase [Acrocarpospora sp. B8E8]|uniref:S9 family peptidase n=1 Tax=Acrocarpospora sp. B8E8 TaxID=3153572 RepID=UPI00325DBF2F